MSAADPWEAMRFDAEAWAASVRRWTFTERRSAWNTIAAIWRGRATATIHKLVAIAASRKAPRSGRS